MRWPEVEIQKFAEVVTGGTPSTRKPEYWGGEIPWLGSGELNAGEVNESKKFITELGLASSSARMMPPHTVMIALTGATVGVTGYLNIHACANQSVTGVLPTGKHIPRYLYYFLKSIRNRVIDDAYGGGQPHISQGYVKKIKVPLPPLEEQKRIAGILDEADRVRKKTQALIDKYDELAQSLFLDMFGDLFSDSTIPLGDLVEFSQGIQIGIENQRLQPEEGFERFLRIIDFTQGDDLRFVPQVDEKYRVKHDDIVMVRYGTVGFVGTNKEGVLANNLFKINYDRKRFNQMFLFHVFQHARFKRFIEKEAYGATMPALSFKVMRTYDIPCPSLKMQNLFAEQIGFIDGLKGTASNSLSNSAKLFNALLQKAFKGELT